MRAGVPEKRESEMAKFVRVAKTYHQAGLDKLSVFSREAIPLAVTEASDHKIPLPVV